MKLGGFIHKTEDDVMAFTRYWLDNSRENPEQFPPDMPLAEWYEQFRVFLDHGDETPRG